MPELAYNFAFAIRLIIQLFTKMLCGGNIVEFALIFECNDLRGFEVI